MCRQITDRPRFDGGSEVVGNANPTPSAPVNFANNES